MLAKDTKDDLWRIRSASYHHPGKHSLGKNERTFRAELEKSFDRSEEITGGRNCKF
jgi:hypothetical protein